MIPPFPSVLARVLPLITRPRTLRGIFVGVGWVACALTLAVRHVRAQEVNVQATPLTAWIDLRPAAPEAAPQTAPTWIEAFDYDPAKADAAGGESTYRIRVHRPAAGVDDLQVRVFFEDRVGEGRPRLSVWNELGTELMRSDPLGQGLGLQTSETMTVPMAGADYLEFSAPGDGSQLRAVFLTWLEKSDALQPADFRSTDKVREPFQIQPATRTRKEDSYLYGVVTARLQGRKPLLLKTGDSPAAMFEFRLERQPLAAVVSYEVLDAAPNAAPTISVNQTPAVASEVQFPDLSDPGYQGTTREGESRMTFRYTGWVRAQKVIPAEALAAGLNELTISLSNGSDTVAIRSVQIQLKYNWEKLDYVVSPAPALRP